VGPLVKPRALRPGDEVAIITPSWAGPHEFPAVFDAGVATLTDTLGLRVREYPTTRAAGELPPRDRARDLMDAVRDPTIAGVIASIGGHDTLRLLPHLDVDAIARNPKVLLGYSDATTLLLAWLRAGVVPFHGPTVMSGLAQASSLPPSFLEQLRAVLFHGDALAYSPFPWWIQSYPDWKAGLSAATAVGTKYARDSLRVLQGQGVATAPVIGGCADTLAFLLGTSVFPTPDDFDGAFLLLETAEGPPRPRDVLRLLWNLSVQGIVARLAGILLGRPRGYRPDQRAELERHLVDVARSCDRDEMPIVSGIEAGHTDPQIVLPLGVPLRVDLDQKMLALAEPAVIASRPARS
jgi:muramoyltetrapeptide carboxypeptidase LdcA involved in peptidoglycan recycling